LKLCSHEQGVPLLMGTKFQPYRGNISGFMGTLNISKFELITGEFDQL